jgi:hypothetical protein
MELFIFHAKERKPVKIVLYLYSARAAKPTLCHKVHRLVVIVINSFTVCLHPDDNLMLAFNRLAKTNDLEMICTLALIQNRIA